VTDFSLPSIVVVTVGGFGQTQLAGELALAPGRAHPDGDARAPRGPSEHDVEGDR
jgi:hypothetical protein